MTLNRPLVISIEGGEGSGKSTIIEKIAEYFMKRKLDFIITREPGGVRISEEIRKITLDQKYNEMDARTEALLFTAARRQHLIEKVLPALDLGKIVIFDRFVDSSLVYQGYVRGIGIDEVFQMNQFAIEGFLPDLTLYLDVEPKIGLDRISQNPDREINKLDLEGLQFHEKVRKGYLHLLDLYPERIVKIDANEDLENVLLSVIKEIELRC
ncbi:dTMP kinase [Fusibacter bizertensis]|uniref:Thymidylate kinase n=1 Tax=Fusibacter bizertensis TaxID=1488331 RepID=A0ABT6NB86_9FIRM|nr:dTMP kinase [Fusibacter bizertensis]MDH8677678.1 dTMP kinase [Fusibacter bizertensis]